MRAQDFLGVQNSVRCTAWNVMSPVIEFFYETWRLLKSKVREVSVAEGITVEGYQTVAAVDELCAHCFLDGVSDMLHVIS